MAFFLCSEVYGQVSNEPKLFTKTYVLKNCHIVPQPGQIIFNQNILIKEGVIQEIGTNFRIPFDAVSVAADSLYVYAGFIDGYSHTGIPEPEKKEGEQKAKSEENEYSSIGVTPHLYAKEFFKPTEKSVTDLRSVGVLMSHVVPRGGMLSGKSDVIVLGQKHAEISTLKSGFAQHFQLIPAKGSFPSTIIGVMTKFQEIHTNAAWAGKHILAYEDNPYGMHRPNYHQALIELYPNTTGDLGYIIPATHTKDIHRVLDLQKKMNFKLILANVKQGWHMIPAIKSSQAGLFLSLDLPELKKPKADSIKIVEKIIEKEKKEYYLKKDSILIMFHQQGALFEKEGVEFGFSFHEVKTDKILSNIRSMVANGLSQETALKALTTYPAKILGVDKSVGTIEKGKLAYLALFDKPLFDEKANLRYIFVDGEPFKYDDKQKKSVPTTLQKRYKGIWSYIIEGAESQRIGKMEISFEDNNCKITIKRADSEEIIEAKEVNFEDNVLQFNTVIHEGELINYNFKLSFDRDSFTGNVVIANQGSYSMTGKLIKNPDGKISY